MEQSKIAHLNPQDYTHVSAHSAWVTRYNANPAASKDVDRGNDMLELDPTRGTRTGRRIDFSALDVMADRENPDTGKLYEPPLGRRRQPPAVADERGSTSSSGRRRTGSA